MTPHVIKIFSSLSYLLLPLLVLTTLSGSIINPTCLRVKKPTNGSDACISSPLFVSPREEVKSYGSWHTLVLYMFLLHFFVSFWCDFSVIDSILLLKRKCSCFMLFEKEVEVECSSR